MPELPEVTTMVNDLKRTVLNRTIVDVWCDSKKNIKTPSFEKFKKGILKAKIEKIERKGKVILFFLNNKKVLIIHPKMSGHFLYGFWERAEDKWIPKSKGALNDPMNRFIHLMFFMDNQKMLAFSDLRKFARIELWNSDEIDNASIIGSIGTDALEIGYKEFQDIIKKSKKKKIKPLLMEQKLIAGIGNIYSDEILFQAGVLPYRTADSLKQDELKKIHKAIKDILKKAIALAGSSVSDFRRTTGDKGEFQKKVKVYRRNNQKCLKCGTIIKRKKIGGRSAHFCSKCQK